MKLLGALLIVSMMFIAGCGEEAKLGDSVDTPAPDKTASDKGINPYVNPNAEKQTVKGEGNTIAKITGGIGRVTLPPKNKLEMVTWKGDTMWILYRPFREGETAERHVFQEDSGFNMFRTTIVINEVDGDN